MRSIAPTFKPTHQARFLKNDVGLISALEFVLNRQEAKKLRTID
jgi:hypothetical protein